MTKKTGALTAPANDDGIVEESNATSTKQSTNKSKTRKRATKLSAKDLSNGGLISPNRTFPDRPIGAPAKSSDEADANAASNDNEDIAKTNAKASKNKKPSEFTISSEGGFSTPTRTQHIELHKDEGQKQDPSGPPIAIVNLSPYAGDDIEVVGLNGKYGVPVDRIRPGRYYRTKANLISRIHSVEPRSCDMTRHMVGDQLANVSMQVAFVPESSNRTKKKEADTIATDTSLPDVSGIYSIMCDWGSMFDNPMLLDMHGYEFGKAWDVILEPRHPFHTTMLDHMPERITIQPRTSNIRCNEHCIELVRSDCMNPMGAPCNVPDDCIAGELTICETVVPDYSKGELYPRNVPLKVHATMNDSFKPVIHATFNNDAGGICVIHKGVPIINIMFRDALNREPKPYAVTGYHDPKDICNHIRFLESVDNIPYGADIDAVIAERSGRELEVSHPYLRYVLNLDEDAPAPSIEMNGALLAMPSVIRSDACVRYPKPVNDTYHYSIHVNYGPNHEANVHEFIAGQSTRTIPCNWAKPVMRPFKSVGPGSEVESVKAKVRSIAIRRDGSPFICVRDCVNANMIDSMTCNVPVGCHWRHDGPLELPKVAADANGSLPRPVGDDWRCDMILNTYPGIGSVGNHWMIPISDSIDVLLPVNNKGNAFTLVRLCDLLDPDADDVERGTPYEHPVETPARRLLDALCCADGE